MVIIYYFDTSAIAKRYVQETGSQWVQSTVDPKNKPILFVSRVTWVELLSALARLQREQKLTQTDVNQIEKAIRYDFDRQYRIVELSQSVIRDAGQLVLQHPLRAYDAIQLASASQVYPLTQQLPTLNFTFVSADNRLATIAQSLNWQVENPNHHP